MQPSDPSPQLSGRRLMLFGFREADYDAFRRRGAAVAVWYYDKLTRPAADLPDTLLLDWDKAAYGIHHAPLHTDLTEALKHALYDRAFNSFRRHFHRLDPSSLAFVSCQHTENVFFNAANVYFRQIVEGRVNTVVFSNHPHMGIDIILYHLARLLGLDTLICHQSSFPGRMWLMREIEDFGFFESVGDYAGDSVALPEAPHVPFYMLNFRPHDRRTRPIQALAGESLKLLAKSLALMPLYNRQAYRRNLERVIRRINRLRIPTPARRTYDPFDETRPFIYFPLHLQPELTTDTLGQRYADQLLVAEALAAAVPDDTLIVLKENPKQDEFMRESSFYTRMRAIPNLRYLSPEVPSLELVRRSRCVVAISGTVGWEALLLGKGVVQFGLAWYSSLPGVHRWDGGPALARAMAGGPSRDELARGFDWLCGKLWPGLADHAYHALLDPFDPEHWGEQTVASIAAQLGPLSRAERAA